MLEPDPPWLSEDGILVFYRIVHTDPPTLIDFLSNAAKGRRLQRPTPEALRRWPGVSAYDSLEQARATARLFPRLGSYVAELHVPGHGRIRFERWPDSMDGHFTLWGEPADFLPLVANVVPVDAVH